jgi:hypothetical protein
VQRDGKHVNICVCKNALYGDAFPKLKKFSWPPAPYIDCINEDLMKKNVET